MPRLAAALLALATTLAAAPWPHHGLGVANEARRVMRGEMVEIDGHRFGTCAGLTAAVADAAEADGLHARALRWWVGEPGEYHATPLVRIHDGRWCGYDYWDGGARYRCSWEPRTDAGWWSRVACCRRGMKYIGDTPPELLDKYRRALDAKRQASDPGARAARRALREMNLERRGRKGWLGGP